MAAELAGVLAPGGLLLWNTPDLGPPGPFSVLFHDPNRALRQRLEILLDAAAAAVPASLREPLRRTREDLDPELRAEARRRAGRRVLPVPNRAEGVGAALEVELAGEVETRTYDMQTQDFVDALLVPSNQEEYLPEIADRGAREAVIDSLMLDEILPEMQRGPAGSALGLNVQWALGSYRETRSGAEHGA
jgi:hypothetical protein